MNSDFRGILRTFNERGVKYLLVGGYAVIEYTEPRYTKDLDLCHSNTGSVRCLHSMAAPIRGIITT